MKLCEMLEDASFFTLGLVDLIVAGVLTLLIQKYDPMIGTNQQVFVAILLTLVVSEVLFGARMEDAFNWLKAKLRALDI